MEHNEAFGEADKRFMREAIALAARGEGRVSPNPPVGCVLVKNDMIVGRGWHNRLGDLHAEAMALKDAGDEAEGSVAYVTLSPCATHGRQPPCADALIAAKVAKVVAAVEDPNPKNASGLDVLRNAGVPAVSGLLKDEAEYAARGFFKVRRRGLPWVTLKYAMTLDGKIAAIGGDSRWVSGPESREMVQDMRSRHDAILVGSGTALADDPLLTVREPALSRRSDSGGHPQPLRVVADGRARMTPGMAMFRSEEGPGGAVLIATLAGNEPERLAALAGAGAAIIEFSPRDGHVPLPALMRDLARRGVNRVLCEGGGELAAGLIREHLVDEAVVFIAPKIVGGGDAPGPVADMGLRRMAEAVRLEVREWSRVGDDIMIRAGFVR